MNGRRMTHWYGTAGPVAGFDAVALKASGITSRSAATGALTLASVSLTSMTGRPFSSVPPSVFVGLPGEVEERLREPDRVLHLQRVVALDLDHEGVLPAAGDLLGLLGRQLRAHGAFQDRHGTGGPRGVFSQIIGHVGEA